MVTVGRLVFLTFVVWLWEERAELRWVVSFCSLPVTDVPALVSDLNHGKIKMILDLTEGIKEIRPRDGPCGTNWSSTHKPRVPWLKAGDAKVAGADTLTHIGICMSLNGNSAPSVQHRMKLAQEMLWKMAQSAVLSKMEALEKSGLAKHNVESTSLALNKWKTN